MFYTEHPTTTGFDSANLVIAPSAGGGRLRARRGRDGRGVPRAGHEAQSRRPPRGGFALAIKVSPAAFADDPERLARFTREAQTLASLNHPNIATIHGIEAGLIIGTAATSAPTSGAQKEA